MRDFTIFPAIDLRQGQVVRLKQGDPERQTTYAQDPVATAHRWLQAGAQWLHVVNLDGAFGEEDVANRAALTDILKTAGEHDARVQFGGGLRSLQAVKQALELGVTRVVLGTVAVEQPEIVAQAVQEFGAEHIAAGLDARNGLVRVHGWAKGTHYPATELATKLAALGLRWLVFTDVARDGIGTGLNLRATLELARIGSLKVIASGGVKSPEDIHRARQAGLAGVIVGRALYEGQILLHALLKGK